MYDPDGDYNRDDTTKPATECQPDQFLPCGRTAYCGRCGQELTVYNWVSLEGFGFCSGCKANHEADCLAELSHLGGADWHGQLAQEAQVIFLTPLDPRHRRTGITALQAKMGFERQYGIPN